MVGVVDPNSLNYWKHPYDNSTTPPSILNPNNCFGQYNGDPSVCGNTSLIGRAREHGYFMFKNSSSQLDSLASMLSSKIPDGHYIIVYSYIPNNFGGTLLYNSPLYANWLPIYSLFQNLGATGFTNSTNQTMALYSFVKKAILILLLK